MQPLQKISLISTIWQAYINKGTSGRLNLFGIHISYNIMSTEAQALLIARLQMVNGGCFIAAHSVTGHMNLEVCLLLYVICDQLHKPYTTPILPSIDAGNKMIATRSGCGCLIHINVARNH